MRRLKQYICLVGLLALLAAALTGCGFSDDSVEELFTLPRMAEEYTGLTQELEALITQGYEYASPTGGRNIQSVQMADLDGDGQQEALAFFRMSSDEKPLKIFVFKIEGDSYARYCTIESSGTAIDSVQYEDLTGNGRLEIIVGWRISADVQTVAVYVPQPDPYVLLQSGYTRFTVTDLDGDGVKNLLLFRSDNDGQPVAGLYIRKDDVISASYSSVLSYTMAELSRGSVVVGKLSDGTPAVFATGVNSQGMAMTDILVWQEGGGLAQPELLCDMLYNLIQNARKATPADGKVEVLLDETPTRLTIRVQDTGCGIPPQELARITEPFYMVDKSRAREQGGSGMGLALCARIAALHGTTLQFASVPSQGTTVSFCLQKAGSQPEVEP